MSGAASQSYGIHVAKIAGVPKEVLVDAEKRLGELEDEHNNLRHNDIPDNDNVKDDNILANGQVMDINEYKLDIEFKIKDKISNIDLNEIRPSEAIRILEDLKEIIHED